jgi:hypothetical protein
MMSGWGPSLGTEVLMPYLSRILGKLRILFDIEWNSQVCGCWVTKCRRQSWRVGQVVCIERDNQLMLIAGQGFL